MATFTQKQIDIFNGDGYASPMGPIAKEVAFGTALETLEARVAELEDGDVAITTLDLSAATTGTATVALADNLAAAWTVKQSSTAYLTFTTTNDGERVTVGKLFGNSVTTGTVAAPIDMAGASHTLVLGTPGAAQTKLVGNAVFVDANTASAPEDLVLPSAATLAGMLLYIKNVGGEQVTVNTSVLTLEAGEGGFVVSDGTAWAGFGVGANT